MNGLEGGSSEKFLERVLQLRADVFKGMELNILEFLSYPSKSCNKKIILQLYKSLIRSRLDYDAPVYSLANKSVLSLLDTI